MQFAKLYDVIDPEGNTVQVLYQRLKHTVQTPDGEQKTYFLLTSTVENGEDVSLQTIPLDTEERLNRTFELIDEYRAEALIKSFYNTLN
jgi:hypothetical protein